MSFKKFIAYILAVASVAFAFNAYAQQAQSKTTSDTEASQNEKEEEVNVSIKFMKWGQSNSIAMPNMHTGTISRRKDAADGDIILWYKSGPEWKMFKISGGGISPSINYKGPREMSFYSRSEDKGADGNYVYKPVTKMTIPANVDELFTLVFRTGSTVRFYPLNVSPKSLPKEKVAILNMTRHPVGIAVGDSKSTLKAGSYQIYTPKKKNKGVVDVTLYKFHEKKWRAVYDNTLTAPEDKRCLLLIYDPTNRKSPKFTIQLLAL